MNRPTACAYDLRQRAAIPWSEVVPSRLGGELPTAIEFRLHPTVDRSLRTFRPRALSRGRLFGAEPVDKLLAAPDPDWAASAGVVDARRDVDPGSAGVGRTQEPPWYSQHSDPVRQFETGATHGGREAILGEVRRFYMGALDPLVSRFLAAHPVVAQALSDGAHYLRLCFGESVIVGLRAPIDSYGDQMLYAAVKWSGRPKEARERLSRFDREWWLARSPRVGNLLEFVYDPV